MLDLFNSLAVAFVHALPLYRAAQDAGIFMLDVEGVANYWASSIISRMP